MKKNYALIVIALLCVISSSFGQTPWINEIHYDNAGGDVNEGVEIAVPTGSACINDLQVIAYNGANGQSYASANVPTTGGTTTNGVTFYWISIAGLQNGAPDGLALVCTNPNSVIQFLSYEGSFNATNDVANGSTSTDIGATEGNGTATTESLQLQGSGCDYSDFSWVANITSTNGTVNTAQTINCSSCIAPTDPTGTITGTTPECSSTTLTYNYGTGEPLAGVTYYWQTASNGTSTANPVTTDLNVTTTGDYYVRAYDGVSCWSVANVSIPITIFEPVNISTQPADDTATVGSNATFTVAATNNTLFQWQVSTDGGGIWTNVGGDSDTYVTAPVTLANTGDRYRVLVSGNSPCPIVTSTEAELTVVNGACIDESFDSFTGASFGGWTATGTGNYTSNASSGLNPNSVQFNTTGDVLVSPTFTNASSLTFWIKGNGTNAASELLIEGFNGASWVIVDNITNIPTTDTTVTYDGSSIPALPNNIEQFRFTYNKSAGNLAFDDVVVVCGTPVAGPEIDVSSNGISISDDSTSPIEANNTNFGSALINTDIVKTYTIRNIGTTNLTLTLPITLTDTSAPQEFTITQPTDTDLDVNESTTFTVTFNSAVTGLFTNEINISNSDANEGNYNFDILANANDGSIVGTAFGPGDLIFVGYDGQVIGSGSEDEYLIANMVDITTGTSFSIVNSRYEAGAAANVRTEKWGGGSDNAADQPFQARITYTGTASIPAGSVIQIRTNNSANWFSFITVTEGTTTTTRTSDFTGTVISAGTPNISTSSSDQMFLIQGDFVFDGTADVNEANYFLNGSLLHGLTNRASWVLLSQACNGDSSGGNSRESRLPSLLTCFNVESASTSAVSGYYENDKEHGLATVREIINEVSDVTNNWTLGSGRYTFDPSDNSNSAAGKTFDIGAGEAAGQWIGDVDSNWFNCANWGNLSVPDASTDVIISSTSVNNAVVDANAAFSNEFNDLANCNNISISDLSLVVSGSINNKIEIFGNVQLSSTGILNMDDGDNTTSDGELYLHGDWINPNNDAFQEGNSTVIFTGNTAQTITYGGTPLPPLISTEQYYNLILNNDFDTSVSNDLYLNGNLTINAGNTLTITSGRYAHVDNIVTNNGTFDIENNGSLIQVKDVDNIGNISMRRNVSIRRLDYVYWSSPVSGFNVNNISSGTPLDRIFTWNTLAANGVPNGQGNWVPAAGSSMQEGQGYIVRGATTLDETTPSNEEATFNNGTPNNGDVTVSILRGNNYNTADITQEDDDWNLLGNPYPSSISALTFLTDNTNLDGFVNIWTHGVLPSSAIPDPFYEQNNGFNYDENDYITYNGTGTTSGPLGFNGFIAAGQSFMVNMVNGVADNTQTATFTNSMRSRTYDNSQFYRSSSTSNNQNNTIVNQEKHRIWLDFASESDNSSTDRILLGYVPNATYERDRLYDAFDSFYEDEQSFYSLIENDYFVIQGRALPFNDNDVIPLGYHSTTSGNYTIAIHAVDGLFYTEDQEIFLKDKLIGFTHNLIESPYTFTSDDGEFNDRFEIVFQRETLSTAENQLTNNDLKIIELNNGSVEFSVGNTISIKHVEIIDLLGRTIYNLDGDGTTEVYDLSSLSQSAYIAKVTLSNGQIITKRAIKKH
ncbi:choice-of-anchor D domain-containing protein [uncultured Psychroserpens sp.]|uniref:choice-of-anchor D domain-containing protein n=1 Tax=uncultured Psychroserpens sp. TaxID=255436 RepID=UPI00262EE480|nr:choice-of-anchor D domain-containing protein [uncultured Psychroserpens sp.]